MTSVGVMASSVVVSADALLEPFNDFTTNSWSASVGPPTIVTGRTGTAAAASGSVARADYNIVSGQQSDTLTVGFAWRRGGAATANRSIIDLYSDSGTLAHNRLSYQPSTTTLAFNRGTTTSLANNTGITFTSGTWYYIELQAKLADSPNGTVEVRVNGAAVITATGLDTKNGGTKTVYDQIRILCGLSSATGEWDDLYLTMGVGAAFKGDITIP